MSWLSLVFRAFTFALLFICVHGLNFVVSPPTQCGSQRFTWVGGTPPFYALTLPPGGTIRNVSIPASAWNQADQSGDFSTLLSLAQGQRVIFSMGDATGETTGGVTDTMTVGAPAAGAPACNTTDPGTAFFFATDLPLQQCKNYAFSLFVSSGAVPPISVLVTVPHGESFVLHPPNNNDPFNWQANLTAGTPVLFTMSDALGRIGGTSDLVTVGSSDDSSCVHTLPSSAAPSRTPSPTGTAPASSTGGTSNNNTGGDGNSHLALIIGVSVGGVIALIIVVALIYFFSKRNAGSFMATGKRIDLTEPGPNASSYLLPPGNPQYAPPPTTFPPYHDSTTALPTGPSGIPPTTMYNNIPLVNSAAPLDPAMGNAMAAGIYGTAVAAGATSGVYSAQPPMNVKQQEAMQAQQRHQQFYQQQHQSQQQQQPLPQHYQQEYFDPYETGAYPAASHPGYHPTSSGRQTAQSDVQSQLGVGSSSNYSSTVGPSTISSAQSSKGKRQSSTTSAPPQQRFIVHTDIEDEPVELPPVYSESRGPIAGMTSATEPPSGKGGI